MPLADRPNVVFVLNGLGMGGAEAQLLSILEAEPAAYQGVKVEVLTLTQQRHPPFVEQLSKLGVSLHTIDRSSQSSIAFFANLVRFFRAQRPSLVHVMLAGTTSTWGRAAAILAGVPRIVLSDLSLEPPRTRTQRMLDPWLHRFTHRFLPNANAIARRLQREGAARERIQVVRNGVNLERFNPDVWTPDRIAHQRATWGAGSEETIVGFLGRLQPEKRPDLALDAVLALPIDRRPDRLWFAGEGSEREELEARIASDPWAARHVELLGVVDDAAAFLAAIDVLLLTSDTEGYPNAVLEAAAMGRPVVATRVSDLPELLGEDAVAPTGNAQALAERLANLLATNPDELHAQTQVLKERVRSELGIHHAAKAFWDAQSDLINAGTRPDVALLLPSLAGGGAERVMLDLASEFANKGVRTELVLATRAGQDEGWSSEELPPGVRVIHLGAPRVLTAVLPLWWYLWRRTPRALLSTLEHTNAVAALALRAAPRVRWVVREANTPHVDNGEQPDLRARWMHRILVNGLRRADHIVAVSEGVAASLQSTYGAFPERITVIENPAITPRVTRDAEAAIEHLWFSGKADPVFVALGRLAPQKRYDILLHAFARVRAERPAHLFIMGEGPERPNLETLVRELGIESDVALPGWKANPFPFLKQADVFVLSSAWEGMPNALIQARALGVPVVSTDCPSGPRELLDDGREGRLVPVNDVDALAAAMLAALEEPHQLPEPSWQHRFELSVIAERYLSLLRGEEPRPLRILLVTTSLMRGGAENQVVALADAFHHRGHVIKVVTLRDPEAHETELEAQGIAVESLHMQRGIPDPRALLALARIVRTWHPDVVHAHMVHANLLARLARPIAWAPVLITTAHNLHEGGRMRDVAYRLTDSLGDLTTNVSAAGVERFVREGATPRRRIERVANGIDMDAWRRDDAVRGVMREQLELGDAFTWLTVGRLEPQKDFSTLLHAFARTQALPEHAAPRLLIVGEGPDDARLKELARHLGLLPGRVQFLGVRDDVDRLLQAADAFVLSSAWEGLPIVLLEAAATELPIVASAVGGVPELVDAPRTGRLVPPHDVDALTNSMEEVMHLDDTVRATMGREGRLLVERSFGLPTITSTWELRYRSLLGPEPVSGGAP